MRYLIRDPQTKEERYLQTLERLPTRELLGLVDRGQQVYLLERGRKLKLTRNPAPFNHTAGWVNTTTTNLE